MSNPALLSHFFLRVGGVDASLELIRGVERLTVESSLHLPDVATLVLHDPQLHWIDAPDLEPGMPLEVWAIVGTVEDQLFDGEIVEVEPEFAEGAQRLIVRAYDRLHRLSYGRHTRSFMQISDAELIQKLAAEVGLEVRVDGGTEVHPYLLQANTSNLNLLRERAALMGHLLYVEGKTLHCTPPTPGVGPVELAWGVDLITFRPRLTTLGQGQRAVVRGWNPETREEITAEAEVHTGAPQIGEARSGGALVQSAFQIAAAHQVSSGPVRSQARADLLAEAAARRRAGQYVVAEGVCRGNPALLAGVTLRISAVGDRFSGDYLVTAVRHRYGAAGYRTEFQVSGLGPTTLLAQLAVHEQPPAGAVAIAIVTDNSDPQGQGRVKLRFPWLSGEHTSDWARVIAPGGGSERGMQWLPEIDDEVLVGFELGDLQHPYVLGGLWNGVDPPPLREGAVGDGKVQQRLIRSRSGHLIVLDDRDEGGLRLEDRNGNVVAISSTNNTIRLEDRHGNQLILDADQERIIVKAKGAITLEADTDLRLKAKGTIAVEADGSLALKGQGARIDGGAGVVDIDGSMIELN